jgi:hypothetical protein
VRALSDAIIVAIIAAAASILGQWMISRRQTKDRETAEAVRDARLEDRISAVEKKLDVHNGYAEKLGEIQTDIAVIKTQIEQLGG